MRKFNAGMRFRQKQMLLCKTMENQNYTDFKYLFYKVVRKHDSFSIKEPTVRRHFSYMCVPIQVILFCIEIENYN